MEKEASLCSCYCIIQVAISVLVFNMKVLHWFYSFKLKKKRNPWEFVGEEGGLCTPLIHFVHFRETNLQVVQGECIKVTDNM